MKKLYILPIIIYFGVMVISFGCSKESLKPTPPVPVATVEFDANGQLYKWDGPATNIYSSSITNRGDGTFSFYVSDPGNSLNNGLKISMKAASLSVRTYTLTIDTTTALVNAPHFFSLELNIQISNMQAASTEIGDFGTVTITSIHDGNYADGTFSAKLSEYTENGPTGVKLNITNGTFKNVVVYQ